MDKRATHFGYKTVSMDEKTQMVKNVFQSVTQNYDLMNDLMSFGTHRIWKRAAINLCGLREGMSLLDLASGTGDMVKLARPSLGASGRIVAADISADMLRKGRDAMMDAGITTAEHVECDAEALPFDDCRFGCVLTAFGLRNVADKEAAIANAYRVLKPGGRFVILEFSSPHKWLDKWYRMYSFNVIPLLGKYIASDEASYRYLAESIRMHPDQRTLRAMMTDAGFERCEYFNMSGGIVAIHRGYRLQ